MLTQLQKLRALHKYVSLSSRRKYMCVCVCVCVCVCGAGSSLWEELIACSEESYRMCVCVSDYTYV